VLDSTPKAEISTVRWHQRDVSILRLDQLPGPISGNKYFKLKYNLAQAKKDNKQILTFGGAYSNHIHAVAAAAKANNQPAIGIIRGEGHLPLNPTLQFAAESGMELHYISRTDYRKKNDVEFLQSLEKKFGSFHHVPEGGSNALGVGGASEVLDGITPFDYVGVPVGTGGTLAGLLNGRMETTYLGFQVVNDQSVADFIKSHTQNTNWELISRFVLGGYAKFNKKLVEFINAFYDEFEILLDPVYTGKMMYGLHTMLEESYFEPGAKILAIHTGGMQGIDGFNQRYGTSLGQPKIS
jgi:1-aminocyclopropane-1-carboxylate deaminase